MSPPQRGFSLGGLYCLAASFLSVSQLWLSLPGPVMRLLPVLPTTCQAQSSGAFILGTAPSPKATTLRGGGGHSQARRGPSQQLTKGCVLPQILIYHPAFIKYVFDSWLQGHGRYPSTGILSVIFSLHICDEVRPPGPGPVPAQPPMRASPATFPRASVRASAIGLTSIPLLGP